MPLITERELREGLLPAGLLPRAWGVARFAAGEECDYHYHDGDEYWFVLEGRFRIIEEGVEYEAGPGDCLFTPMGSQHKLIALTDAAEFWLALELHGEKREGHLHREE